MLDLGFELLRSMRCSRWQPSPDPPLLCYVAAGGASPAAALLVRPGPPCHVSIGTGSDRLTASRNVQQSIQFLQKEGERSRRRCGAAACQPCEDARLLLSKRAVIRSLAPHREKLAHVVMHGDKDQHERERSTRMRRERALATRVAAAPNRASTHPHPDPGPSGLPLRQQPDPRRDGRCGSWPRRQGRRAGAQLRVPDRTEDDIHRIVRTAAPAPRASRSPS